MWGVEAMRLPTCATTEALIAAAVGRVVDAGWVQSGQRVAITAGLPSNAPGTTSLLQVQEA